MKRVIFAALLCAGFLALFYQPALAVTEFCPARIQALRAVGNGPVPGPSQLFGLILDAHGARQVETTLAFDTNAGWFTADLPRVQLVKRDFRYTSISAAFTHHDWASPVMYVRFPRDVAIEHAWVESAKSSGDGFGWNAQGPVACLPPGGAEARTPVSQDAQLHADASDREDPGAQPEAGAIIAPAQPSRALGDTSCPKPFEPATVTDVARAQYPPKVSLDPDNRPMGLSTILVAIAANGAVADAWVWGPSGYDAFDTEALRVARASTYRSATSYCQAVPGEYLFKVTFDPRAAQ